MIRLSIIVPCYNVEKYVEECIRSMYNQDIPQDEYEVICVDDCSPDHSVSIIKQLQKEYSTLRLIHHERNRKLGGARNTGLKMASGKYVWFVDSDDYISPNCLLSLLNKAEENDIEVLLFDFQIVGRENIQIVDHPKIDSAIITGEQLLYQVQSFWYKSIPTAWNKLYLRDFLTGNKLFFADDVMYEDTDWTFRLLEKANKVLYVEKIAYNYRVNVESITKIQPSPEKMVYTILQQNRCAIVAENTHLQIFKDVIYAYIQAQLTVLRTWIKAMSIKQQWLYGRSITKYDIHRLKSSSTWRTWLAIRYGITCFVK